MRGQLWCLGRKTRNVSPHPASPPAGRGARAAGYGGVGFFYYGLRYMFISCISLKTRQGFKLRSCASSITRLGFKCQANSEVIFRRLGKSLGLLEWTCRISPEIDFGAGDSSQLENAAITILGIKLSL